MSTAVCGDRRVFRAASVAVAWWACGACPVSWGIGIQSSIDHGPWTSGSSIYPLRAQHVRVRVDPSISADSVRWYQIVPDVDTTYKNANHPWERDPYQWVGFAAIDYCRRELRQFRDEPEIVLLDGKRSSFRRAPGGVLGRIWRLGGGADDTGCDSVLSSRDYRSDVGSFWLQVEVDSEGRRLRSPGLDERTERGLSPSVFRVSVRGRAGYLGYLTTFFNVPGVFGAVPYQARNFIGVDCAEVVVSAHGLWTGHRSERDYSVATLVESLDHVAKFKMTRGTPKTTVRWQGDSGGEGTVRPGDLIAVRYRGGRTYSHVGALYDDANGNGRLDAADTVIHAGPQPLRITRLASVRRVGWRPRRFLPFDGQVVILRAPRIP